MFLFEITNIVKLVFVDAQKWPGAHCFVPVPIRPLRVIYTFAPANVLTKPKHARNM
jgi:hypothetical protein